MPGPVNTGKAIRYAMANLLTPESGIRDDRVQKDIDVYLNTNPDDDVKAAADEAGRNGIVVGKNFERLSSYHLPLPILKAKRLWI